MAEPLAFDIIARDRASDTAKRIGKSFGNLKASTVGAFAGMSAAVTNFALNQLGNAARAVKDFVVDSVRQFAAFDTSMREVWTLLPDLSAAGFASMQDDVRTFTKEMGVATTDAVPALYQAISSGVPPENVFDFLTSAAKLSIGGVTTLETAVDGLTSVTNAYGKENLSAERASDLFFTAVKLGKTTIGELSTSLFQVVPTAAALGVGFETVTAALAAMTVQGVPTAVATTQLRQLLVELNKEGGKAAATFQDLSGKSFANFVRDGGSVQQALALMAEHAKDGNTSLSNLFGSVEAGNAALALTSESGAAAFNSALGEMAESSGATDEAFGRMDEGIGRSWDKLKVRIDDLKLSLGEKLAPALEGVLDWFEQIGDESTDAGERFGEMADAAKKAVDEDINPALERWRESSGEVGAENQEMALLAITALGKLAGFWINNIRIMTDAANAWKDFQVDVFRVLSGAVLSWAEVTLGAAVFAFGWVPGLGDQLRGLQDDFKRFRQNINEQLDKIHSKVDINVHTRFTTSGAPPTAIGGGSQSVFFGQHGGEVPGPFTGIDRVPAMLTAGEWVVDRPTAQSNRALLANLTPGGSTAGGGPSGPVVVEIRSGGSRWDDLLVETIARAVGARGGNAQLVLGTGG